MSILPCRHSLWRSLLPSLRWSRIRRRHLCLAPSGCRQLHRIGKKREGIVLAISNWIFCLLNEDWVNYWLQVQTIHCVQVKTFKTIWRNVADNLDKYVTFPKLIGGEKDWEWRRALCQLKVLIMKRSWNKIEQCFDVIFYSSFQSAVARTSTLCTRRRTLTASPQVSIDLSITYRTLPFSGTVRSAWEYSGQKCSACSRMYVPASIWPQLKEKIAAIHKDVKLGDVRAIISLL